MIRVLFAAVVALCSMAATAEPQAMAFNIEQSRGSDARVAYADLTQFGPWDDRNYALTVDDIALLGDNEAQITDPIPAFFRVEMRKANPKMPRNSDVPYPLSALNAFLIVHQGYQIDGTIYTQIKRREDGSYVFFAGSDEGEEDGDPLRALTGEVRISTPAGAAESAIAINPVNPDILVAGSNGPNPPGDTTIRQKMWYSSNGGSSWARSQPLSTTAGGNVCCDPTVSWSTDGTKAYASALINCGASGCGIRIYRSDDNGVVWGDNDPATTAPPPVDLATTGADKQFIHVDSVDGSSRKDNVYVCWHAGNVNKFARSTDFGVTFSANFTVDSAGRGVGCDLTTDRSGNIYYFYPALDSGAAATQKQIRVAKSTDGGLTFSNGRSAAPTFDAFNYALPSMETRKVAKIVQAGADLTTGPYSNSIYVIYPDIIAAESGTAANNHSQVRVAYSRDGGDTWAVSIPHPVDDVLTVDRYQPSIMVDGLGRVHVIYYDTRHSTGRTGVDVYYNISYDGGATWGLERRVTTQTSANINDSFEFGDYSHMDGVLDQLAAIYTDNRAETPGGTVDNDVYGIGGFADPFAPTYLQAAEGSNQTLCAGDNLSPITLTLRGVQNYSTPIDLSVVGAPATLGSPSFSVNPVTPTGSGATSTFTARVAGGAAAGPLAFTLRGISQGASPITRDTGVALTVQRPLDGAPSLTAPSDAATSVRTSPDLSFAALSGASSYRVQIATNAAFTNIVVDAQSTTTTFRPAQPLAPNTTYYWRVRAQNSCGMSSNSAVRSFTTALEYCATPGVAIPDNNLVGVTSTITVPSGLSGNVVDMDVQVGITHTFIGDLRLSVRNPAGTAVRLINNPPACSADNINTSFDDEASSAATCATTEPALGPNPVRPLDVLSAFDGGSLVGTWTFTVIDSAGSDVGTLDRWCLVPAGTFASDGLFANGFEAN